MTVTPGDSMIHSGVRSRVASQCCIDPLAFEIDNALFAMVSFCPAAALNSRDTAAIIMIPVPGPGQQTPGCPGVKNH